MACEAGGWAVCSWAGGGCWRGADDGVGSVVVEGILTVYFFFVRFVLVLVLVLLLRERGRGAIEVGTSDLGAEIWFLNLFGRREPGWTVDPD